MAQARTRLNEQIYQEAAGWLVRHRTGALEAVEKKAYDTWLRTSPEHIRAYLEISAIWENISSVDLSSGFTTAELIERAKRDVPVLPLSANRALTASGNERDPPTGRPSRMTAARYRPRLAATIAAMCITAGLLTWSMRQPTYTTGTGEQRSVTLADGSTVELNARSEIRVHFVRYERDIDLVHGQALFHVAKDATRPLIVRARSTTVRAVGTQFDVNELRGGTIVTVIEGLVAVFSTPPSHAPSTASLNARMTLPSGVTADLLKGLHGVTRPIFLGSGEQLTVTAQHLAVTSQVNAASATAWTLHKLVFDAAPLSEVVDEFNRYNKQKLVIASPQLDDFRINGFFSSTDPSLLLQFLRNQPEIVVEESSDEIRLIKK